MKKQNKNINTKRIKKMKTIILTFALVFTFFTQFSFSNNFSIEFEDEKYINDIPFNTEEIAASTLEFVIYSPELILEEENYINDIPFNTGDVVSNIQSSSLSPEFILEEEDYINDIPFNTNEIYFDKLFSKFKKEFEDEASINDIPFNTEEIANNSLLFEKDFAFESEEKYIDDIPFDTYEVSINSIEYYQTLISKMNNKIQSMFNNCCSEQIENLSPDIFNSVINVIEKASVKIINESISIVFP